MAWELHIGRGEEGGGRGGEGKDRDDGERRGKGDVAK